MELSAVMADIFFGHLCLYERMADTPFLGCFQPGSVIPEIIKIGTVDHGLDAEPISFLTAYAVKLVFAKVTPIHGVPGERRVIYLVRSDDDVPAANKLS
jgi:hypothetical protein